MWAATRRLARLPTALPAAARPSPSSPSPWTTSCKQHENNNNSSNNPPKNDKFQKIQPGGEERRRRKNIRKAWDRCGVAFSDNGISFPRYTLVLIGLLFAVFIFWAFRWNVKKDALLYASATLVAILPEACIVLITVTMAIGARRMAARNAIVRKISALEELGRVTDICSDKVALFCCSFFSFLVGWVCVERERARERDLQLGVFFVKIDVMFTFVPDGHSDGGQDDAFASHRAARRFHCDAANCRHPHVPREHVSLLLRIDDKPLAPSRWHWLSNSFSLLVFLPCSSLTRLRIAAGHWVSLQASLRRPDGLLRHGGSVRARSGKTRLTGASWSARSAQARGSSLRRKPTPCRLPHQPPPTPPKK